MPRICVVGLGPGGHTPLDQVDAPAELPLRERLAQRLNRWHRGVVTDAQSFDHLYDSAVTFDEVYAQIAELLVAAAKQHNTVLYAVPGSPSVLERSVQLLRQHKDVVVEVFAAVSFLDCSWAALGIDPIDSNVRLIDGHLFAQQTAGDHGPFLVAHCHANWVLSDIKLAAESEPANTPVVLLHHVGLDDENIVYTTWSEIDRIIEADHLTSLYIPRLTEPVAGELVNLHQLARTLREQCPWDQEQTHESLIRYLIEETYEVVDALQALQVDDPTTDDNLIEELGDLLYQVEFHAAIAEEEGRFTMADIARTVHDKLVRRHPHIFANVTADTSEQVSTNWDAIKKLEKPERTGIFDGVVQSGPSLLYAQQLQKKASKVGFDWPDVEGPLQKIHEETNELHEAMAGADPEVIGMELGDLLFSVVNVARHLGLDAEVALRSASRKFQGRVEAVRALAEERGIDMTKASLEELDALWNSIKLR